MNFLSFMLNTFQIFSNVEITLSLSFIKEYVWVSELMPLI